MKRLISHVMVLVGVFLLTSCGAYRRTAYLQDLKTDETYIVQPRPEARISVGDKLSITVTCSNPALAAPFNIASGHVTYDTGVDDIAYAFQEEEQKGYLVDKNGDIDFPVLGKINVAGTTLQELKKEIEYQLKSKPYILDPLVFVEFMNFQVTMLGQIANGNYIFKSGSVTILEALAEAGSVSGNGVIDELWVIRTTGGARKLYTVNLKSKSLYDSPVYYLQQNDLIYAKPKDTMVDTNISNVMSWAGLFMSAVSMVTTLFMLATRL